MNRQKYYQSRINKAIDYINKNLHEDIDISTLAAESHFSLFHFQRIFKAVMNETPYESLLRLRLEKSIFLLKYHPNYNIKEIALKSGFPSPENFSRQFKTRYECSPSDFRKNKEKQNSRIYQENNPDDFYLRVEESRKLESTPFEVSLESLPEINIAFCRAIFGADGSGMVEKYLDLIKWAEENNIEYQGELKRFGMSIDNPEVTPASKFRYDFALRIHKAYEENETVEYGKIPKAKYATLHVKGKLEKVAQAWEYLYRQWLPTSGYVPVHYPAIEEFVQGPEEIGWEDFNIKCRIAIIKQKL